MSTPKQAIALLKNIHNLVTSGRCKSQGEALKLLKKDRQTTNRFKYVYYLHHIDRDKFDDVSVSLLFTLLAGQKCLSQYHMRPPLEVFSHSNY